MHRLITLGLLIAAVGCGVAGAGFVTIGGGPTSSRQAVTRVHLTDALSHPYPAPEFLGIKAWINSPPLTLRSLRGKVVLIDFWTYSCINCVRTLPHLVAWDRKYRKQGLVIVGVHTPEFTFEKSVANIKTALAKDGIEYPVAVDSSEATWNAYKNEYWPAHYLIDQEGKVVYTHFGEGDYDITENNIRALLGLGPEKFSEPTSEPYSDDQTPETYLGSDRAERKTSRFNSSLPLHYWSLAGQWKIQGDRITSVAPGATLRLHFNAKKVFLVMGPASGRPVTVDVKLNGQIAQAKDAPGGVAAVSGHTLYELVDQDSPKPGLLELTARDAGVEMYAFTFGN